MKKPILIIAVVFAAASLMGQSLSLSNEHGAIPDHSTILVLGDPADNEIVSEMDVTNNSTDAIDVMVFRRQGAFPSDSSWSQFCWGVCFAGDTDTSAFAITIQPGPSTPEPFSGHYHPRMAPGSAMVAYVFYDANDMSDSVVVNVEYKASPAGYSENPAGLVKMSEVYPNPSDERAFVDIYLPEGAGNANLIVSNLLGSVVKEIEISKVTERLEIPVSDLKNGLYFVSIRIGGQAVEAKRIVVNH
ncbi:MAG: T9SS type A sorting domain-containing protein [Bacteroidales bacterium]